MIPSAAASLVSTLDGHWLTRVQYRLRFTGSREVEVRIPAGVRLSKVFRDRVALPFTLDEDRLRLQLSPARSGGEEALLELVLEQEHGAYHLAGRLDIELPELSWPIHEITLDLHLPPVFAYRWLDGSLSPAESVPDSTFTYDLPEPGKRLSFRQLLVSALRAAPLARLRRGSDERVLRAREALHAGSYEELHRGAGGATLERDVAAAQLGDRLHDREAEAGAAARALRREEALEDARQVASADARAAIPHAKRDALAVARNRELDGLARRRAGRRCRADCGARSRDARGSCGCDGGAVARSTSIGSG